MAEIVQLFAPIAASLFFILLAFLFSTVIVSFFDTILSFRVSFSKFGGFD